MIDELSDWMYGQQDVMSYDQIAKKIKVFGKLASVNQEKVGHVISRCRTVMELRYKTTLINIRGLGYKVATPDETALTTAKWVKRTIMYADRTYRLVDITDRKLIPNALKKVFMDSEGRIRTLSNRGKKFIEQFVVYSKQKQLEDKTNGKENKG